MRRFFLRLGAVSILILLAAGAARATSALEFLRAEADNQEAKMMKEVVIKLVAKGYKNVPDWPKLSSITKKRILQKGYTSQEIDGIAEEAAFGSGMTK
jgi:hypothetical protein